MKMVKHLLLICWCSLLSTCGNSQTVDPPFTYVSRTGLQPVLNFLNCTPIKQLFGVDYVQRDNRTEPNVATINIALYNANGKTDYQLLQAAAPVLASPDFVKTRPTVVILHGFLSSQMSSSIQEVVTSFKTLGGYNILTLDADSLIGLPFYMLASTNIRFISEILGDFIYKLMEGGVDEKQIHLVGHSLGAHMSGFAAKRFRYLTGGTKKIGRVSGLDPAGPCFFQENPEIRLNKNDALFVDVIHTSAMFFGISVPLGHVDFFPNNAEFQPGCFEPGCDHTFAQPLYASSILNPTIFKAVKCASYLSMKMQLCSKNEVIQMGFHSANYRNSSGVYFLRTGGVNPYGLGDAGINLVKPANIFSWLFG